MRPHAPRFGLLLAALFALPGAALAREPGGGPSDRQARERIVRESVAAHLATGHPCACPHNTARNGLARGRRSAYTRPSGAVPLYYATDAARVFDTGRRRGESARGVSSPVDVVAVMPKPVRVAPVRCTPRA